MISSMNKALDLRDSYRGPDLRLFVRDVRDTQGRKRALTVRSWSTVKDVKDVLQQILHVPPGAQRLYFGPLMTSGGELPNHRTLHDAGIYKSGETLLLEIKGAIYSGVSPSSSSISALRDSVVSDVCVSSAMIEDTPKPLRSVVQQARRGLNLGLKPELVLDGSGGTYFLHDARKVKVAVFKPADEEPYAENNPRGYVKQGNDANNNDSLRAGICPGEACLREVAAYLLDHKGFSGVPMTTLAEARHPAFHVNGAMLSVSQGGAAIGNHALGNTHAADTQAKKVGSFQTFVKAECTIDDLSPSMLSVEEVHKVAILDIRIMNADRNSANLLCRRRRDDSVELVPIDHGYCLRSVCDVSWMDWCWLDWPQLKKPLSERSKKYILGLDIDADARLLKEKLNLPSKAIDYFRASSKFLQEGVKAGLTLYDIAVLCCRNDDLGEIPSKLEVLSSMASELAAAAVQNGRWHHAAASHAIAEQLSPGAGSLIVTKREGDIPKSASSVHLSSLVIRQNPELEQQEGSSRPPAMTQSSASDSGSEVSDAVMELEEREEWAAAVVADVSMSNLDLKRNSFSSVIRKQRSISSGSLEGDSSDGFWHKRPGEEEEDSSSRLSSSPVGFWYTRPSSALEDSEDDDASDWSPNLQPREIVDLSERKSLKLTDLEDPDIYQSPTVRFIESWAGPLLPPPATVDVACVKKASFQDQGSSSPPPLLQRKSSSMSRSKSYSAFSSIHSFQEEADEEARSSLEFRDYFAKFVDLVICRETTARRMNK